MTRTTIGVSPDGSGKRIALDRVDDAGTLSDRQIIRTAGDNPEQLQAVLNAAPGATEYGAVVRVVGDVAIEVTALIAKIQELLVELQLKADLTEAQPVSGPLTDVQLRATAVPVTGTITAATDGLTDAELRASPVPVSGMVGVTGVATEATLATAAASLASILSSVDGLEALATTLNTLVDGLEALSATLLTDAQLRATPVPVSGTITATGGLTDTQLRATPVPVSGTVGVTGVATETTLAAVAASVDGLEGLAGTLNGLVDQLEGYVDGLEGALTTLNAKAFLTDTELRATAVPVSLASVPSHAVTGPLTDTQLRATPVPVSAADLDIRNLSQGQDAVAIYGSDDGGTTKRVIKTDAGGAIQIDLEVSNVTADTELTTADLDTGGGTDTRGVVGLMGAAPGGGQAITGDTANGLDVDVVRLPALPAGTSNIGDVDVLTVPVDPFGANADAAVAAGAAGSIQAKLRRLTTDLDALKTELQLKADLTETQPVSLASVPSHAVTGPLTDAQLRATAVPVSGTVTASGPLTDTQLRASAVPVSGPATDAQIRASAVPVSLSTLPTLPAGANAIGKLAANSGVDIGDVDVTSIVPPSNKTSSGNISGVFSSLAINTAGCSSVCIALGGTWVGTVSFSGSVDGSNFFALPGIQLNSGQYERITLTTANLGATFNVGGLVSFIVFFSAWTSGTASVVINASTGPGPVYVSGPVDLAPSTIAAVTSVASSATNVTLLNALANRKSFSVFNESTQVLYLKFGATSSLTSYTVQIPPGGYYEPPAPFYNGRIDGLWAAANGSARITETS